MVKFSTFLFSMLNIKTILFLSFPEQIILTRRTSKSLQLPHDHPAFHRIFEIYADIAPSFVRILPHNGYAKLQVMKERFAARLRNIVLMVTPHFLEVEKQVAMHRLSQPDPKDTFTRYREMRSLIRGELNDPVFVTRSLPPLCLIGLDEPVSLYGSAPVLRVDRKILIEAALSAIKNGHHLAASQLLEHEVTLSPNRVDAEARFDQGVSRSLIRAIRVGDDVSTSNLLMRARPAIMARALRAAVQHGVLVKLKDSMDQVDYIAFDQVLKEAVRKLAEQPRQLEQFFSELFAVVPDKVLFHLNAYAKRRELEMLEMLLRFSTPLPHQFFCTLFIEAVERGDGAVVHKLHSSFREFITSRRQAERIRALGKTGFCPRLSQALLEAEPQMVDLLLEFPLHALARFQWPVEQIAEKNDLPLLQKFLSIWRKLREAPDLMGRVVVVAVDHNWLPMTELVVHRELVAPEFLERAKQHMSFSIHRSPEMEQLIESTPAIMRKRLDALSESLRLVDRAPGGTWGLVSLSLPEFSLSGESASAGPGPGAGAPATDWTPKVLLGTELANSPEVPIAPHFPPRWTVHLPASSQMGDSPILEERGWGQRDELISSPHGSTTSASYRGATPPHAPPPLGETTPYDSRPRAPPHAPLPARQALQPLSLPPPPALPQGGSGVPSLVPPLALHRTLPSAAPGAGDQLQGLLRPLSEAPATGPQVRILPSNLPGAGPAALGMQAPIISSAAAGAIAQLQGLSRPIHEAPATGSQVRIFPSNLPGAGPAALGMQARTLPSAAPGAGAQSHGLSRPIHEAPATGSQVRILPSNLPGAGPAASGPQARTLPSAAPGAGAQSHGLSRPIHEAPATGPQVRILPSNLPGAGPAASRPQARTLPSAAPGAGAQSHGLSRPLHETPATGPQVRILPSNLPGAGPAASGPQARTLPSAAPGAGAQSHGLSRPLRETPATGPQVRILPSNLPGAGPAASRPQARTLPSAAPGAGAQSHGLPRPLRETPATGSQAPTIPSTLPGAVDIESQAVDQRARELTLTQLNQLANQHDRAPLVTEQPIPTLAAYGAGPRAQKGDDDCCVVQ